LFSSTFLRFVSLGFGPLICSKDEKASRLTLAQTLHFL
jgi:hypothetical protein